MSTYDIGAFQTNPKDTGFVPQELWDLHGGDGILVTGIIKLCQRFLLELLTVKGTIPFDTKRGSSLLTFVRTGQIRNDIDAYVYFQYSIQEVLQNLWGDELTTDPNDERIKSVDINSVSFLKNVIVYSVQLNSMAGASRQVQIPLQTLP